MKLVDDAQFSNVSMDQGWLMKIELPPYDSPPPWKPPTERLYHPDYNNDIRQFLPRSVKLRRSKVTDALGFNVRGGKEYLCGIYISKVSANTEAERLGLQEGDQILFVNGISFENIEHSKAVKALKSHADVEMTVKYFPYGYNKTYDKSRALASLQNQPHVQSLHQPIQVEAPYTRDTMQTPTGHQTYQNYDDLSAAGTAGWQHQYPPAAHQLAITPDSDTSFPNMPRHRTGEGSELHVRPIPADYYNRQPSYSAASLQPTAAHYPQSAQQQQNVRPHISEEQRQRMLRTPNKYV